MAREIKKIGRNADLPTADQLKQRFAPRSVPLATDFGDLIDVAEMGRRALGESPADDGTPGPGVGPGLKRDDTTGILEVCPDTSKGIEIDATGGVGVKLAETSGLKFVGNSGTAGLAVGAGAGVIVGPSSVSVRINMYKGIEIDVANGVGVKLADSSCLLFDGNNGMRVSEIQIMARLLGATHYVLGTDPSSGRDAFIAFVSNTSQYDLEFRVFTKSGFAIRENSDVSDYDYNGVRPMRGVIADRLSAIVSFVYNSSSGRFDANLHDIARREDVIAGGSVTEI